MASLVPCPQCQRHVRRGEAQCPFCGAACALAPPSRDAALLREAKRASLIALGLALAGQACGGKTDEDKKRDDVGLVPPYGIGPIGEPSGGTGGTAGSGGTAAGAAGSYPSVPPYGLSPVHPEGGSGGSDAPDGGTPDDAGTDDAGTGDAGSEPDAAG
jgi:hypothetical protein